MPQRQVILALLPCEMAQVVMWSMMDDVIDIIVMVVFPLGSCSLMSSLLMTSSPFLLWWLSLLSCPVNLLMILFMSSQQRLMMRMCPEVVVSSPSEMLMQGPDDSLFSRWALSPNVWDDPTISLLHKMDEEEAYLVIRWCYLSQFQQFFFVSKKKDAQIFNSY